MDDKHYYAAGCWAYEGYLAELRQELSTAQGDEFDRIVRAIDNLQDYLRLIEWRMLMMSWQGFKPTTKQGDLWTT